jgi:spore germination protein GerM
MTKWISKVVLLVVPCVLLGGCTGRTILHGSHKTPKPSARTASANKNISVWFVKPDDGNLSLVSVGRKPGSSDRLAAAVEELLEGPSPPEEKAGLGTEIPRGTILLGVKQLRRTVDSAANTPVYLSVEGKRMTISEGEGIEIRQPINR